MNEYLGPAVQWPSLSKLFRLPVKFSAICFVCCCARPNLPMVTSSVPGKHRVPKFCFGTNASHI